MAKKDKKTAPGKKAKLRVKARRRVARRVVFSVIVLLAAALVVLTIVYGSGSSMSAPGNLVGTVVTRVQRFVTDTSNAVKGFFTDWHAYDALSKEYSQLNRDYESLSVRYQTTEEMRLENERLNSMLGARTAYPEHTTIFTRVCAREAGTWFNEFTIDVGTANGVSRGMAVVSADGLVGLITDVGYNFAKVRSIIDSRSSIAVLVQSTRDNGIMKGQISDGTGSDECFVYYLPDMNNINPGDTIVTSGTDSQYLKGITVGTISAISVNESSEGTYALVKPAADFERLEELLVILYVPELPTEKIAPITTAVPVQVTPTPEATSGATPEPSGDPIWQYPTATPSVTATPAAVNPITDMLEDKWAEN